jgi:hypothetical protein
MKSCDYFDPDLAAAVEQTVGRLVFPQPTASKDQCRHCGCTDDRACPGGCCWVGPNLCSRCA